MKRIWFLAIMLVVCLTGCGKECDVTVTIPAGNESAVSYSETEVTPTGRTITIMAQQGMQDCAVCLKAVDGQGEDCEPVYLTPGVPVELRADKDVWYKIDVSARNPGTEDCEMRVTVKGTQVRIS